MKKVKLKNYVIINGKEYEGKSTIKEYSHAVVSCKNNKYQVSSLSGDAENAEKAAQWNRNDCLKLAKQGYKSQEGCTFSTHELISEPIM